VGVEILGVEVEVPNPRLATVPPGVMVVILPPEVKHANAIEVNAQIIAVMVPGNTAVVLDFTRTTFCDSACLKGLVKAERLAYASGIELRLVVPSRLEPILALAELDRVLPSYPTLSAALNPSVST
jgi:anti-anti-sigma factor